MLLSYINSLTRRRVIPVLLITLIIVACTAHSPEIRTNLSSPTASINTDYNWQQIYSKIKIYYKLVFIRALIKAGYLLQAKQQLAALPSLLDTSGQCEHRLLKAELALALHQPQIAYTALQQIDRAFLDYSQRVRYSNIMITTGQSKPSLDLVRAYIHQETLLQDDSVTHQQNIDSTWETLLLLPPNQINININYNNSNYEKVLQGWLDLLSIYLNNSQDITMLQKAITHWQQTTSDTQHPAAKKLPTKLSKIKNYQPLYVEQIAMLLPLSGQATVFTNAIKQGFSSAHAGMQKQDPVPSLQETAACSTSDHFPVTRFDRNVTVKIYDTTNNQIPALLAQANRNGARMIIGPLLKHEVEQLYNADTALIDKLNIIALNKPDNLQLRPNICYFALTPEDEAREAAHHIYQHGRQQPLLLLPRGTLGDRIATAFTDAWHQAGGGTVLAQRIGSTTELKQSINSGVGIKLTGMPVISRDKLTNLPVTTTITSLTIKTSKQDNLALYQSGSADNNIDAVYIIATPDELLLIKPMIDMNISANARLALYASSRSYNYDAGPDYRLEMEGLEFSDIQLLTDINPALLAQTSAKCGGNYYLVRLYAMGMDAWMIAHHFNEMRYIPGFKVLGNTGTLSATTNCLINSKFSWFKYQRGKIIVIH